MTHRKRFPGLARHIVLAILAMQQAGCDPSSYQAANQLVDIIVEVCPESTVWLSSWWSDVGDDSAGIEIDPMGGYVALYWVDEDGNACHGTPGLDGQLGPAKLNANYVEALQLAEDQSPISLQQLSQFQGIPFDLGSYDGSGPHFVQFNNLIWRVRDQGTGMFSATSAHYSYPQIVNLGQSGICLSPVFAYGDLDTCALSEGLSVPTWPGLSSESGESSTACRVRAAPTTVDLSREDLMDFCLVELPHGT